MPPIRILLAKTTTELRAMVHTALVGQPDLVVGGDVSGAVETLLQAGRADVVILGMSGTELPLVAERLVDEYPRIGVLAIDVDRAQGLLYQLSPQLSELTEITSTALVGAIRRAAGVAA